MSNKISLDQCRSNGHLRSLPKGEYTVEYNDSTHCEQDEWVGLAKLQVSAITLKLGEEGTEQFYTLEKNISGLSKYPAKSGGLAKSIRFIEDSLSLALARAGLLTPNISDELLDDILRLASQDGIVIVPDTNALHNGSVHWLLKVLRRPAIWLLPLAASLTTVQMRDATIKALVNQKKPTNIGQALRSRGLVNGALGLLQRNRSRSQVVELDPSLLRYQKTASSSGSDPDQSDVLEDRLIIEAIQSVLRTMRSRTPRRVVTSDVNVARVLEAEGIETLFIPTIQIGDSSVECLRYDPIARMFLGAPLSALLWELAHGFGSIRLRRAGDTVAHLDCYWPGKTPSHWSKEILDCNFSEPIADIPTSIETPSPASETVQPADVSEKSNASGDAPANDAPNQHVTPSNEDETQNTTTVVDGSVGPSRPRSKPKTGPILPRASLPAAMKILGVLMEMGQAQPQEIVAAIPDVNTTDTVKRALELLQKAELVQQNEEFAPTADANTVATALEKGDLDTVSRFFNRFEPYAIVQQELQREGRLEKGAVLKLLTDRLGKVGKDEANRLPKYHILLGQAWTMESSIMDGSNRLTDRDAAKAFEISFANTQNEGLAKVYELLMNFCQNNSISPWVAKSQIERLIVEEHLSGFKFESSAGAKPVTRDEVLVGNLTNLASTPIIVDRFHIGERPVLTIGGPAQ
ncbi:hypothetical protein EF888_12840 [Silicimonas algicola]|uniref:PIN domain-containing protein n=1 Tax=Silicimonas algicola TaxID=1826607 RepID=A0A316GE14_9RHOB|nr:hypothetical protein [Silicimonas algicola]AZQ67945.1 hypothetical protein EF888_12840 [Silicimonas algicola]PWK57620.1 hypothetical protein C8D95_102265 [Silicimonas algicola]